jgi:hypothetical protein
MSVSNTTGYVFIDSQTNSGALTLPNVYDTPGRVITFKDSMGTFQLSSLTLTAESNQFVDTTQESLIQTSQFGWTTLIAGTGNTWLQTSGTQINTITTSTINVNFISTPAVVLSNMLVSSIYFVDVAQPTLSTILFLSSQNLYYSTPTFAANIAGGFRQSFGTQYLSVLP